MRDVGQWVYIGSVLYVLSWIPIAYAIGVLFPGQMLKKYPKPGQVITLLVDGYFWGDLFLFAPLLGAIWSLIWSPMASKWSGMEIGIAMAAGLVSALLFQQFVIVPGKYPSDLGGAGRWTWLGVMHIPFFAFAFGTLSLFLISHAPAAETLTVAGALLLIIPAGILVPTHFIRQIFEFEWIPNVFAEEGRLGWMIGGSWAGVGALAVFKLVFI